MNLQATMKRGMRAESRLREIPLRILIVDPDPLAGDLLQEALKREPKVIDTRRVADIDSASAEISKFQPNVIFIDAQGLGIALASEFIFRVRNG